MTVLITGGTGFVGLALVEHLLARGETVVTYGPAQPPEAVGEYLRRLGGKYAAEIGDVCDAGMLGDALRRHHVDRLVHGAAITAGPGRERSEPLPVIQVNLIGTLNVLEAALAHGVRRVVQLGTGSVYGASAKRTGMLEPDVDPATPDSLYGITKYAAERLACRYRATRALDVVVARLGVVFGRWEHDTGVRDTLSVPYQLVSLARGGQHASLAPVLPDDWVYVRDVARAVELLLEADAVAHEVYQIASGRSWSAAQWCELLAREFPGFTYDVARDAQHANVGRVAPTPRAPFSIERLRREFGYAPAFPAHEALRDYREWLDLGVLAAD